MGEREGGRLKMHESIFLDTFQSLLKTTVSIVMIQVVLSLNLPPTYFHWEIFFRKCLLTRLPHLKCIRLGSVRSSHPPFKMH